MRFGKMTATFALALIACVACATNSDAKEKKQRADAEAKKLATAHNEFGIELFKKLHKDGENTFISPTSISICMQMARQGAGGDTAKEMDTAMHLDGIDVAKANHALIKELNGRQGVKLVVANSLWADPARLTLNQAYADEVVEYFDSEARVESFADPETVDVINKWISTKTNSLIPKMLDRIPAEAVMYLINAIYFKGDWSVKFEKENTKPGDWHNADGTTKKLQLMRRRDDILYAERDGAQIAKLPYGKDEQSSMLIVLPKDTESLGALVTRLTPETVAAWSRGCRERDGTVKLPRFEMSYKETLNDALQAAGIKTAFESGKADFSHMGESPMGPLFINRVLHEARVIVNEEGTEAAAATVVEMGAESLPPEPFEMTCDRPFLFFITDEPTGAILFMGTVYEPQEPSR